MSDRVAILDTNVLGVAADLSSPLWVSIERLCVTASVTLCLPEIVLHETINLRREQYLEASKNFLSSFKQISRFFDASPVYVPDVDEIVGQWESDLRETFQILHTEPVDAVEALKREASRLPPARGGRGARDTLVWLAAMRQAAESKTVLLVSRNTEDFSVDANGALHQSLAEEAKAASADITYFIGLDSFIEHIANKSNPPDVAPSLYLDLIGFDLREALVDAFSNGPLPAEDSNSAVLQIEALRSLRAYEIDGRGLALLDGVARLSPANVNDAAASGAVRFMAWVEFGIDSKLPVSGEVHKATPYTD